MEKDVISQLPDEILISIISEIPTKEALRTSILSKRWRNLSRFLPALSFVHKCADGPLGPCNSEAFINVVHGVLQRRLACIDYLHLHSCLPESASMTFEQCIISLRDLGIQELEICLRNEPNAKFHFSSHLLSLMPSLEYLKLSYGVVLQPSLKNQCSSLKEIRLSFVSVSPGSLECILSNCSSLWKLTLKWCSVHSTLCFPRLDLQLMCFVIRRCQGLKEICFYAPNLKIFDLECHTPVNLKYEYVPQLQFVRLNSQREDVPYFCERLGRKVSSLNTLILDRIGDVYQDGSIAKGSNMFNNLKRLKLSVFNVGYDPFSLIQIMHGCPRLEEFQLATSVHEYMEWPEEEKQVIVHSRLKEVDISGFVGSESEFAFISYIAKSAVELQRMVISWCTNMSRDLGFQYGKWEKSYFRPTLCGEREWGHVCETIQQVKHEAVSKTLHVVAQEFPQTKPIKLWVDDLFLYDES